MILGAILAGGRSSRMGGGDKGGLDVAGTSILRRVEDRLRPQVDRVAVIRVDVLDTTPGPLRGLHAALSQGEADHIVTVSTDVPFIPDDLVRRLSDVGAPAIAASGGQRHYVIGLWPRAMRAALEAAMANDGLHRAQDWAALCGARVVEWPALPYDPFFNVNTPDDLAAARRIALEHGL